MEKVPEHKEIINAIIDFGNTLTSDTPDYRSRQEELPRLVDL